MTASAPMIFDADRMAELWVEPAAFVAAVESALRQDAVGCAVTAPKVGLYPSEGGLFHVMPAVLPDLAIVKWLSIGRGAAGNIHATILATNPESGRLIAMLDAERLTDLRTAAVSLLAMRYLADTSRQDSFGIIGCGRQALAHLEFLPDLAPWIRHLVLWSPNPASVARAAAAAGDRFDSVTAMDTPQAVLGAADIVLSATRYAKRSRNLLRPEWLKPDALVLAVDLKSSWDFSASRRFRLRFTDDIRHSDAMVASGVLPDVGGFDGDLLSLLRGEPTTMAIGSEPILFLPPGLAIADAGATAYFLASIAV